MHAKKFAATSNLRQTGNRPIPLTCSVVEQMIAGFHNFCSLKKVKIRIKIRVEIYLSEKKYFGG